MGFVFIFHCETGKYIPTCSKNRKGGVGGLKVLPTPSDKHSVRWHGSLHAFQGALTTRKVYSGIVGVWDDGGVWEEADAGEPQADGLGVNQSCVPVVKDILWETYSLAASSTPEKAPQKMNSEVT